MTNITERDIKNLEEQINKVDKKVDKMTDKLDVFIRLFQLKEDAHKEYDRLEKKVDTLTARIWGVVSALIITIATSIIGFFFTR